MRRFLPGGLWRHRDFLKLWAAETISQLRLADLAARAAARRDHRARRERLRGRAARRDRVPPVHPVQRFPRASGSTGCGGSRSSSSATSAARLLLASIPLALLRFDALTLWQLYVVAFLGRRLHGLLRRRLPVVPAVARRARAARRGQLEARDQPLRPHSSPGPGSAGVLVGALDRAVRGARRRDQLPRLGDLPLRDPQAGRRRPSRTPSAGGPGMMAELEEGLRFVSGTATCAAIAG